MLSYFVEYDRFRIFTIIPIKLENGNTAAFSLQLLLSLSMRVRDGTYLSGTRTAERGYHCTIILEGLSANMER